MASPINSTTPYPISFRPATGDDAENVVALRSDPTTRLNLKDPRIFSVAQCANWLNNLGAGSERYVIEVEELTYGFHPQYISKFIGLFRVDNIDTSNHNCCVGLDLLKEYRGRGLGFQTYKLMLDEFLLHRNMDNVWLEVLETNETGIALYRKLGFKQDGVLRNRVFRNGTYINCLVMSLLRTEWLEKKR